ncbi:MAG: RNA polymerase sigma factor [Blastocatellia bacterium]|nr:RNA polymerase sigma factor [Blastocatellia bacterium]
MPSESEAFTLIFHELFPKLCRFVEGLLNDSGSAPDIAQETLLRLYRFGIERIPPPEIRFWAFRVARNLALNAKARSANRNRLLEALTRLFQPAQANPETELEQADSAALLVRLLQTLPEDQRAALLLREQEEMKYSEIAAVLGVSESKVKVDVFRARQALRTKWHEHHRTTERRKYMN